MMELNHSNTVKQTLQSVMENEEHLCLSDSDSSDSETHKPITYSSPGPFHSASDSDDSTKSPTDVPTHPTDKVTPTNIIPATSNRDTSISHDFSKTNSTTATASNSTTATASNSTTATASLNRDSTKVSSPPVESPARSSVSSDQISLPHDSFTLENNKPSAAPTRSPPEKPPATEPVVKRSVKEEPLALVKADLFVGDGTDGVKQGGGDGGGGNRRRRGRPGPPILRKAKMDDMVKKAALGLRIFGFLFCLVSFSVMAADRNKGWALDSFERYKEFRYCMSVNVIGFVYSGAQAFDLAYQSATGKNIVQHHLRYMFDFALDQMVTYLLISASSSAATRIDDWQSNWGKDKFPDMASASVAMSFLSFAALAFSSLISGYVLCKSR